LKIVLDRGTISGIKWSRDAALRRGLSGTGLSYPLMTLE
jgi:hypothetical protein